MVGIRRTTPRSFRGVGKPSTSPVRSLIVYGPVLLIGLAVLYGMSMLMALSGTSKPGSIRGAGDPMSVAQVLQTSQVHLPRKDIPRKEVTASKDLANLAASKAELPLQQQPPPPIQKYNPHLEDPDIHMLHPDVPAVKEPIKAAVEIPADASKGAPIHHVVLDKKGTGKTNVAYVRDFETERSDPSFRHLPFAQTESAARVAHLVQEFKVSKCRTLQKLDADSDHQRWTIEESCLDSDTPQIVYNPENFSRFWCGQEIGPGAAVTMNERCSDPTVHLFTTDTPPSTGSGMAPMIITMGADAAVGDMSTLQSVDCDIPCLQQPGFEISERLGKRFFDGEPWSITQTFGDSYQLDYAKIERTDYRRDHYYSTQSFRSSVPLTNYDPTKFSLRNRPPISFEEAKPRALYLVSTMCAAGASKRYKYHAAISNVFPVDNMGQCSHNTDVPAGMRIDTMEGRIALMRQYRFILALDATKEKDHIASDIWEALISGSVPVIVGAENMRVHLPANSYVDSGAYEDWDKLAIAIKEINENKEEWESYHAWRTNEAELAKFEAMYEFAKTDPSCRLCRWGYAKKYGLGWDQVKQKVTDPHMARDLCTTSTKGLASKPFQEEWISRNEDIKIVVNAGDNPGPESCSQVSVEGTVDNGSTYKIQRSLVQHDGITDILITDIERESTQQELVLRLHFPGVRNSDGAHFQDTHTTVQGMRNTPFASSASMQDGFTKVTIVADWITSISCPMEGVLEVVVVEPHENEDQPSKPLWPNIPKRIRVILEDMNVIHDKLTEYFPSSFAKLMIRDFVDPLEVYYADAR